MSQGRVLIVDDDREVRASLSHLMEKAGYAATVAADGQAALDVLRKEPVQIVVCDVRMPGMDGLEFQKRASEMGNVPVILVSAHGDIPMAVNAIQNGAYSFLEKPFDPRRLLTIIGNGIRMKRLSDSEKRLRDQLSRVTDLERVLIGESPQIVDVRNQVIDCADSAANVLIVGDTGSGKELVARALHDLGRGPGTPFVAINCAVVPPDRFEEAVFGTADHPTGLLQQADEGTLFLDELTSMPLETQGKFLRVLETKSYQPLNAAKTEAVDIRIVSAAGDRFDEAVAEGQLRQDLLFRLNTLTIKLPNLADRGNDVLLLYRHYLQRFATLYDVSAPEISNDDVATLLAYEWPGNVRELQSVAERRILAARRGGGSVRQAMDDTAGEASTPDTLREAVAAFEREIIAQAIADQSGRMDDVAEQLGIGRRTLNEKIVKLGIDKERILGGKD